MLQLLTVHFLRAHSTRATASGESPQMTPTCGEGAKNSTLMGLWDGRREGPGMWKWRHYFEIYERHFARFRGTRVRILEIGVFSGGSLCAWRQYFGPQAIVYGLDLSPLTKVYEKHPAYGSPDRIFIGSQSNVSVWDAVRREAPGGTLDIILDDGAHASRFQIATLNITFDTLLAPGGVYLCEDIVQSWYGNAFHEYVWERFLSEKNGGLSSPRPMPGGKVARVRTREARIVAHVTFYIYVIVIEKRSRPLNQLSSEKHGTVWQPQGKFHGFFG